MTTLWRAEGMREIKATLAPHYSSRLRLWNAVLFCCCLFMFFQTDLLLFHSDFVPLSFFLIYFLIALTFSSCLFLDVSAFSLPSLLYFCSPLCLVLYSHFASFVFICLTFSLLTSHYLFLVHYYHPDMVILVSSLTLSFTLFHHISPVILFSRDCL